MKRFFVIFVIIIMAFCFSACNDFKTPLSLEQVRESSFSCFSEHNEEMRDIISRDLATGETDWCNVYDLLSNGQYEFVLYRWGFTGTNISAGILYLPDDKPNAEYEHDTNNSNVYTYTIGADEYYLERIETNWFYFYYEYDF